MSPEEFEIIMNKLKSTYGDKIYGEVRTEFIWSIVREFKAAWFDNVVIQWICSNTKAILVNEIREAALKEKARELQAQISSPQRHQPISDSIFETDDIKMMFEMMKRKMNYQVLDKEWKSFQDWVEDTAKQSKQNHKGDNL